MNRKRLSNIIIILAIFVMLLPWLKDKYHDTITERMLRDLEGDTIPINEPIDGKKGKLIKAEKIDLKMPITNGATFDNMIDHVATIRHHTLQEGENYSIAGHRYIRKGRHFNRLDELAKGDIIEVVTEDDYVIKYTLKEKLVVEPSEVEVLEDSGETELTLITCHPPGISSHRLVLKAIKED